MVRFLNYQHFFDFKISIPMLKNEKLKKLCIRHHTNNIYRVKIDSQNVW